jgi:hypothetical protein
MSDEAGANHTALMKQMGIRKRETLEKYTKTNKKRIEANVEGFNSLLKTLVFPVKILYSNLMLSTIVSWNSKTHAPNSL